LPAIKKVQDEAKQNDELNLIQTYSVNNFTGTKMSGKIYKGSVVSKKKEDKDNSKLNEIMVFD
jgi:hypothetical protein